MRTTDQDIAELVKKGIITGSEAMLKSSNRELSKNTSPGTTLVPSSMKAGRAMGFGWL